MEPLLQAQKRERKHQKSETPYSCSFVFSLKRCKDVLVAHVSDRSRLLDLLVDVSKGPGEDFLHGRQVRRRLDPLEREGLHRALLKEGFFGRGQDEGTSTLLACSGCSTESMNVLLSKKQTALVRGSPRAGQKEDKRKGRGTHFRVHRHTDLENHRHILHVDTSSGHVRREEHARLARLEFCDRPFARFLGHPPVQAFEVSRL